MKLEILFLDRYRWFDSNFTYFRGNQCERGQSRKWCNFQLVSHWIRCVRSSGSIKKTVFCVMKICEKQSTRNLNTQRRQMRTHTHTLKLWRLRIKEPLSAVSRKLCNLCLSHSIDDDAIKVVRMFICWFFCCYFGRFLACNDLQFIEQMNIQTSETINMNKKTYILCIKWRKPMIPFITSSTLSTQPLTAIVFLLHW